MNVSNSQISLVCDGNDTGAHLRTKVMDLVRKRQRNWFLHTYVHTLSYYVNIISALHSISTIYHTCSLIIPSFLPFVWLYRFADQQKTPSLH
jgi:hypothetical protein